MDIFEFVLVMVSLVLAIGLTGLLRGVSAIISDRASRRIEALPLIWTASLFVYAAMYWWSLWDFQDVTWTFPAYFFLLLIPTFLYIAMDLLVRLEVSSEAPSRSEAFTENRLPFFTTMIVVQIAGSLDDWLLSVSPLWSPFRWLQIFVVLSFVVGAISSRLVVQKIIAAAFLVILLIGMFGARYLPGPIGAAAG